MITGFLNRILSLIPTLLIGITFSFIIIHLAPGDPATRFLNPNQTPEVQSAIRARFGLDRSLPVQYGRWLKNVLLYFDFGYSFYNGKSSRAVIAAALKPTAILAFWALLFALVVGISLGILAALKQNHLTDLLCNHLMLFFLSMPGFWLGLMLIGIFSIQLGWLPGAHFHSLYHYELGGGARLLDSIKHLILPVITLGLPLAATFFKYIRSSMIETISSDFILAAKARGIHPSKILWKYALRHSLLPVISVLGVVIPALLSGAVIIEVLFALPGVGRTMVTAVYSRDYPVLMAAVTFSFIAVIVCNLLTDICYRIVDPRIQVFSGETT